MTISIPLRIKPTSQFKKDYKKIKKQGKDLGQLEKVVADLARGKVLDKKYCNHQLSGKYQLHSECHINPDWLLIYKQDFDRLMLVRTGSHADLF